MNNASQVMGPPLLGTVIMINNKNIKITE